MCKIGQFNVPSDSSQNLHMFLAARHGSSNLVDAKRFPMSGVLGILGCTGTIWRYPGTVVCGREDQGTPSYTRLPRLCPVLPKNTGVCAVYPAITAPTRL